MNKERSRISQVLHFTWRLVIWCFVFAFVLIGVPEIKRALFPDLISRLDRALRNTTFDNCMVQVERERDSKILLAVSANSNSPVHTEIYNYILEELEQDNKERNFFVHTINLHEDQSYYLTQTQIWTNEDIGRVHRLEVKYCDRLVSQDGRAAYDGHLPVFECAVSVREATCFASAPR